jgi:hypothetical protein
MKIAMAVILGLAVMMTGCNDNNSSPSVIPPTAPIDVTPPAAPRGVFSVTGDGGVTLHWLANTEFDVAGYRVYEADCPNGPSCPYLRVGSTGATTFVVGPLSNGVTKFFAVAAVDQSGNESDLSYENVMDTPRPAGTDLALSEATAAPALAGYDFSAYLVRPWDDPNTDVYYQLVGGVALMVCPFIDTDIQDAGYASTLDAVDFAPLAGWAASGTVELIPGHCYLVRIGSTSVNYGKFRVTSLSAGQVVLDWAYQIDPNNRELKAQPAAPSSPRVRRPASSLAASALKVRS